MITKYWNASTGQYEWIKGNASALTPYFAQQSQTDPDVIESGKLTGLSCAGQFEIETPFFAGTGFNDGVALTYSVVGDSGGIYVGYIKVASAGDIIIGYVSGGLRGPIQLNPLDSAATGGSKLYQVSDSTATTPVQVVRLVTAYNGAKVPA